MNLTNPELVGPLRIPRKQYAQLLLGFCISLGFAGLMAGVAPLLIVAGLWLVTLAPIVRIASGARRWKTLREQRIREGDDG